MALLSIPNVRIAGIASCVPQKTDENSNYPLSADDIAKLVATIGVERKRITDPDVCSSDLCFAAAEQLIADLGWNKDEIKYLVFVSQTPDYITPATSCILQHRLGLSTECAALDVALGCSGWVYGLNAIASSVALGRGKGLLLVGDTISKFASRADKSTFPLFGDAGTATAIEYKERATGFKFHLATDGEGYNAIIIKDGGYRNPTSSESLRNKSFGRDDIRHNDLELVLDGMNVFSFGLSRGPQSVNALLDGHGINKESVDYYIFHQANLFMNEKIRKKLKLAPEKVPYSLRDFGNTSCATIPLTMTTQLGAQLNCSSLKHIGCAFGVGLSWGSVYFETDHIVCPKLIEI